ncbi:MAG: 7-carboxy-7-deazaguanine synthase QueE [Gammaproteobacteria bacterium]
MRLGKNSFSLIHQKTELIINEIFYSIQGESSRVGLPTTFIRLTGCPLRCQYCDTEYAFTDGEKMKIETILDKVKKFPTKYITVTGGEPLAQKSCNKLLESLCNNGYDVSLETSGSIDVSNVDKRIKKIVDIKTPGSSEVEKNNYENLKYLTIRDEIKFVICDRADYVWAKQKIIQEKMSSVCEICFSPVTETLAPSELANWILEDSLDVRMQIQLHKYLWGDTPGK